LLWDLRGRGFSSFWRSGSGSGGLRLSAVACWTVALADLSGCVWGLSRVGVSCVACVCLCLASALCLSAPMLLGVSLDLLCNHIVNYDFPSNFETYKHRAGRTVAIITQLTRADSCVDTDCST
jgi:hypothetical protein